MHALHAEVLEEVQVNQSRLTELILPRKEPESNTPPNSEWLSCRTRNCMMAEWQRRTTRSCTTAFGDPAGSFQVACERRARCWLQFRLNCLYLLLFFFFCFVKNL